MKEILDEMSRPPADTPERRATFEMAHLAAELIRRTKEKEARAG
ncbi:MAG TPA: hypothetical protein VFX98_07075 [Longimicrobiaceae bacterium]|nr:hypothetical protein [Longimicrobiaceae bacterium]